jgi:hypothetical protein
MGTVLREGGFDFKINTDDHAPAHVHVWYQGNVLIVNFRDEVTVRNNLGFNNSEMRRAVRIISAHQVYLQEKWREIHQ